MADSAERLKVALSAKAIYARGAGSSASEARVADGEGDDARPRLQARVDAAEWLALIERRVIIPVKWLIWGLTLVYWFTRQSVPDLPELVLFGTYFAYFLTNVGFTYLACISGIEPAQARVFSITSLICDLAFVSAAVYADSLQSTPAFERDFYIFLILLVIRGLVVLRSAWENLFFGVVVTVMLLAAARLQLRSFEFLIQWEFTMRMGLVWIVFSISWYLLESLQRQQRELLAMREQLIRQEDLAMLGEVSAGIAHEINNPLGIISACADFVMPEVSHDENVREEVETIRKEARRCKRIVQELLDLASPEQTTQIGDRDARELCDEALGRLPRTLEPAPEITRAYPERPPLICVDGHKMVQALSNVLDNAVRNARGRARIAVRIREEKSSERNVVVIEVIDNGPGISPEDRPHIFKPFFSRRPGGTGLGLAIARRILRAHRGDLTCHSAPGQGTMMTFTLPALDRTAPPRGGDGGPH